MKKQIIFLAFAMILFTGLNAQGEKPDFFAFNARMAVSAKNTAEINAAAGEATAASISRPARFPGGRNALADYLSRNIRYSETAREYGLEGKVKIQFAVLPDGSLAEVKIIEPVHEILDASAMDLIQNMPRWEPALHKGKAVKSRVTVPLMFSLK